MRCQLIVMFTCLLQVFVSLPVESQAAEHRRDASQVAYLVYSTILQNHWAGLPQDTKRLVISAKTFPFPMCLRPDGETLKTLGPAMEGYSQANKAGWRLKAKFYTQTPYELASVDNAARVGGESVITFSAIGFNDKKTVAVIGVRYGTNGGFVVLEKNGIEWQPLHKYRGSWCGWAA